MDSYQRDRTINLQYLFVRFSRSLLWIVGAAATGAILFPVYRFLKLKKAYTTEMMAFERGFKDAVEPTPVQFPSSYIVIGLLIGVIFMALVIFLRDFLSPKVKCIMELDKPKDTPLLAFFKYSKDKKAEHFIKKLIHYEKANPIEKETELFYSRLITTCRNQAISHLVFAGETTEEEAKLLFDTSRQIRDSGVPTEYIGDILSDPQAILKLSAEDGVVLVVQVGYTSYKLLDEEIELCKRQNTKLVGFAAFE